MKENEFKSLNFSLIGQNSLIDGDLKFSGETVLNCKLKGKITMLGTEKLTLERESHFEGQVYCHDIEVFGSVRGTIHASGTLSIRSSANVSGNIKAKRMSIFPGAVLNIEGHTEENTEH